MKKILYLFILCVLTLNLFACNKKKVYNAHTNAKISDENYKKLITNFIANLSSDGYDCEKRELEYHDIFLISLDGDLDSRIWVYVFKPQNIKYYVIEPDTFSENEDDYLIYIPEGEGEWMLSLYACNDENCYYAILSNDSDIESIATMIFEWMK